MRSAARQSRGLLLTYLKPQTARVAVLSALLLASIGLQLANPQVLRAFLDTATTGGASGLLARAAGLFIGIAILQQACSITAAYFSERVAWTATNALRADLALHCLRLDLAFHKTKTPGEFIERIDGDVTALANFFSQFVLQIVGSLLLLAGVLTALWLESWRAGLPLTVFAVVMLAVMARLRSLATPYWKAARQASAELFGFLEERLGGAEDIRSSGAAAYVLRRLYERTRERLRTARLARLFGAIGWCVPMVLWALGVGVAFIVTAYLYRRGTLSTGSAFLIYYYTQLLFQPLNVISYQLDDFQKASAGLARIEELFGTHSALADGVDALKARGALAVEFDRVAFGYGDDEMVVRDLTFRLPPGAVLGLLGRTGSGKTTIARLLFRLYDPAAGTIRLGGSDVRSLRRAEVRDHVGMVTQDVQLFRASVRDNLTFFDEHVDDTRIIAALEDLGLGDWRRSLPDGLDTMLAANGGGLSAGQAQLLALTRVFLRDPGVVILDEASSRLDPVTERLIERAIDKLLRGRTAIIIAHRLRTIERADEVMILEHGRIQEYGSRRLLAGNARSRFAHLLHADTTELAEALA